MPVSENAVGTILEIPPTLLADIQKAERYIDNLQINSKRAAEAVKSHWGEIATSGLDTFIQRLADAQNAMKGMSGGKVDFNINTNQATEKVSSASRQIEKDLYAISKTVQQVAQDFDFSNPEASLKKWGNTFREIEAQIRNTSAVRKGMATDDPEVDKYNRLIEVLKEYIAQKKKSQATVGAEQAKAAQDYEKWWLSALAKRESEESRINKKLTDEYKRLYAENQKLFESMRKYYNEAGGNPTSAATGTRQVDVAYREIEARHMEVLRQMRDLESKNIQEIANFRQQKDMEANQRSISEFIQFEAQKTAEAKKQADERARQQSEAQQKYLNSAQGAMWYSRQLNKGKVDNSYENRERAIKQLESAIKSLDKNDKDYDKTLEKLTRTLNVLKNAQKEVADAMKPTKPMVSPQDAINAAKNATSLKQLQDAYKQLKDVMATTDPKSQAWSQMNSQLQKTKTSIDEIKKKMGEFHTQSVNVSGIVGQLRNQIASLFAVGAITNYIKKMTEVRAQFELQRVALGAIIQDSDEANKIFLRIQQMALESPFNIMQLERATKQIAAFGFETQKLVPTMKMFADISAGLGVEIDRITLVMGHLKARNFLEGTMVRQFTNMGFNILGELAKYYTELEDRLISVGEVQDRVKKKMISFEDVEEVLKRVTSQGGMFYDMQRKQAESLYGQIQRIKDATDLMLNDIGKSNQSLIGGALTMLRTLIAHWRDVWNVIKMVGSATAAYVLVTKAMRAMGVTSLKEISTWWKILRADIATATTGVKASTIATNALSAAMKGLMSSTGIGIIVAALATLASYLWMTTSAADALNEELGRISDESVKNVNESIATFRALADTVRDSSKLYSEREEAMKELSRIYGDILPKEKLEWDYIVGLNGDYKELTETITKYYAAKEYQQKVEQVLGGEAAKNLISQVQDYMLKKNKDGVFGMMFPESVLKAKAEAIARELSEGKIANSADAIAKRIAESLNNEFNYKSKDFNDIIKTNGEIQDSLGGIEIAAIMATNATMDLKDSIGQMDANQLAKTTEDLLKRNKEIEKSLASTPAMMTEEQSEAFARYNVELEANNRNLELITQAQAKLVEQKFEGKVDELTKNLIKEGNAYADAVQGMKSLERQGRTNDKQYQDYIATIKKVKGEQELLEEQFGVKLPLAQLATCKTSYEVEQVLDEVAKQAFPAVAKAAFDSMSDADRAILMTETGLLSFLQNVKTGLAKFSPTIANLIPDFSAKIAENNEKIKAMGVEWGKVGEKAEETAESIGSVYSRRANAIAAETGADIRKLDDVIKKNMNAAETAKQLRSEAKKAQEVVDSYNQSSNKQTWLAAHPEYTAERLSQMKKDIEGYTKLAKELDGVEKGKKGGKGKDPWQDRLSLFKEINTEYEKLLKNYSAEESKQRIQLSYAKAVAEIFKGQGKFGDINNWLGFDKDSMIKIGQQMLDSLKISPEKRKDMEKQLAGLKAEVDVHFQEDAVKNFEKHMQEVADNLELSETFRKLGVPIELTYSLGGKPTTLADQRKELEDNYYEIFKVQKKYGDEGEKAYDKIQQDIAKKEQKNLEERAKNYIKYLTESMGERAQIEIKALQDVNKIREDETLDSFSKEQAIMQRRKKMNEELSKMDLDSLKSSDVYISVFKDLESASKEQLQYVLDKLRELQSTFKDLSPAQVKSIANEMKKIEDALADRDSIKNLGNNLRDAIRYARQRNKLLREQTNIQDTINKREDSLARAQVYLNELQIKLKGIQDESSDEWQEANRRVQEQQSFVKDLQEQIEELKRQLEEVTGKINDGESAWNKWRKGISEVAQYIDATKQSLDDIFDGIGMAFNINDATRDAFESISEIMGGLSKTANGLAEIDLVRPFTIITGLGKAIGGVFSTIGGFFGIGDKKKERSIKRLTEKVETLDQAYQRLEKSIENAYTFDDYKAGYSQMQENLSAEKSAYEEMLALEKAKKKTDKEKVKEYEDALKDIAEKQKELQKSLIEDFGSTTDYRSAAEDFVSAWLDAFKETGDGLDALNENWQEFIQNLFIKQAAMAKAGDVYKDVIDIINNAMAKGKTDFSLKEAIAQAQEAANKGNEYMNDYLKALAEVFNIRPNASGELILSDLQKGIQNITEPQAAAIEAYLNSMRFAVFRHTEQLDTLIATIQMQYGGNAENPVVTELKGIRGVLDNIYRDLHSVVKSGVGKTYIQVG